MTQQLSPFINAKWGWNYGESGWNGGMDENLLKFSYLFDRNIDAIVSSLPSAVSGKAYFLTADNRLYFAVGTTFYSSPTPKWFTMYVRDTGATYQFDGTSLNSVNTDAQIDSRLDAIELTLSTLGTSAFLPKEYFASQSALDVASSQSAAYTDLLRTNLAASTGSTLVGFRQSGTGAVTRTIQSRLAETYSVKDFGAMGDGVTDDTAAFQKTATAVGYGGTITIPRGTYFLTSTVNLRGATKLRGTGIQSSVIYRTGDYGDTFVCGTAADQSEPARNFECTGLTFSHSLNYTSGSTTLQNKVTHGAHLRIYGGQEVLIEDCWFHRLTYQLYFHGSTWVKLINCQFLGVYDQSNAATQESIANVVASWDSVHGNPTSWTIEKCNFLGATFQRDVTYTASPSNKTVNIYQTVGPLYGLLIQGLEDVVITNNYFGGQSIAEIAVINPANSAVIDVRISKNFFDGITNGNGILFAPEVANQMSLGVIISENIFVDNLHAIFVNRNVAGGGSPSVYNLEISNNMGFSGIGTQLVIAGARGLKLTDNQFTDYNKYNISATDLNYTTGCEITDLTDLGEVTKNTFGAGTNILTNFTTTNFCYGGVYLNPNIQNISVYDNYYLGIRDGSNFRLGRSKTENIFTHTANGNYQMLPNAEMYLRKTTATTTANTVVLPLYPMLGREVVIKDAKGDAATFSLTVSTGDSSTIDGGATKTISTNYGSLRVCFNGTSWFTV